MIAPVPRSRAPQKAVRCDHLGRSLMTRLLRQRAGGDAEMEFRPSGERLNSGVSNRLALLKR